MAALAFSTKALLNVAFAGVSAGLFARGALIIASAGTLAQLPPSSGTERVAGPRASMMAKVFPKFPQLAPEKDETIVPVEPTVVDGQGTGPLVPIAAQVVGITWFDVAEWSLANVVYNNEHTVMSINECAPNDSLKPCNLIAAGYKLKEIHRDRIRVLHLQSMQMQDIGLYGDKPVIPVVAAAEAAAPAEDTKGKGSAVSKLMDGVKQTGPNSWEAPAGMREDVLGRLNEVAMEGRWLPYFENGKIAGFKLAQTVSNSAFEKIGLKSGDIIKSVNGYDISSPDKMLEVFTKLREARDFSVDIQRGDAKAKTSLKYTVN